VKLICIFCILVLGGCAQIPVERTYSIQGSDGKRTVGASVTLRPPAR
jgi:hypothetical protein